MWVLDNGDESLVVVDAISPSENARIYGVSRIDVDRCPSSAETLDQTLHEFPIRTRRGEKRGIQIQTVSKALSRAIHLGRPYVQVCAMTIVSPGAF